VSTASLIQSLRNTRVLVVHPRDRDGDELARQLKRIGCRVDIVWPPPPSVPPEPDVIYFLLDPDQPSGRSWRNADLPAALIAVIDFENPTILKELLDSNAHGVLVRPIKPAGVLSTLVLALSNRSYVTRLLGKVAKLEDTLKARREIEKATRILMTLRNIPEREAYEFIRRQASAKRITTAAVATSIIHAQEILGELDNGERRGKKSDS
jgi:AmiR/NasT family two-component response regulator